MSRKSEAVKTWRQKTKQRIIDAMGGKCVVCGYDKCTAAFDLHHLDPAQKKFGLGGMRANPIAWSRIVEELRKCILVCANCHREIESGEITDTLYKSTFDESFVEYQNIKHVFKISSRGTERPCDECGTMFVAYTKKNCYCSDVCRKLAHREKSERTARVNQRPSKTRWPEKETLKELLQTHSRKEVAKLFTVSDAMVRKWIKDYKIGAVV